MRVKIRFGSGIGRGELESGCQSIWIDVGFGDRLAMAEVDVFVQHGAAVCSIRASRPWRAS